MCGASANRYIMPLSALYMCVCAGGCVRVCICFPVSVHLIGLLSHLLKYLLMASGHQSDHL